MMTSSFFLYAVGSGIAAHNLIFRHGEWDVASPRIFAVYAGICLTTSVWSTSGFAMPFTTVSSLLGAHILGLYSSMLIYRAFFHRLRKYPGPALARLSNFYITAVSMRRLQLFKEVQKLHDQHGDYVRLGPSELSIADPEAVKALYGSQSPVSKGPWYTLLEPRTPLFMARDKAEHARRRKVWDQGFSTKALQGYEYRITHAIQQLLHVIQQHKQQPINMTDYFTYFAFDVMEDLAFNQSSNMVKTGKAAYVLETIRQDMYGIALFSHLPWLLPLVKRTPFLNRNYLQFWDWIQKKIDQRTMNEPDQPDIFSWILSAYQSKSPKTQTDHWNLHGDAQLIVIAGSDSVAASLTHIFCELACRPELVARLQAEFDSQPGDLEHDNLIGVELLDAVIHETMRLHPPVPSGTQRVTPEEGLRIGKEVVPGGVIVQIPSYTVFRDSRAFEQPNDFIPERWTTRPELIKDRSVFIPFNIGPYGCVGKRLAMMELRRVIAETISRYDIHLAPECTREEFLEGKEDTFTTVSAPLHIVFTDRAGK